MTELENESARTLTLLAPFDRPLAVERSTTPLRVKPRRWLHALERALVDVSPFGALRAMARTGTRLLHYQLEPALAMLRHGATRVLIADAVGLGKTIEAGIALLELATRSDSFRGIVLVPAGLRDQWATELATHFGLATTQADAAWLRRSATELPPDVNPWWLPGTYIASHDFVKRPEALRAIEDVTWDLVIVDEAHAASFGTDRRAAIHALACRSRRVILLTATPNAGHEDGLTHLANIGRLHTTDPPTILFARARADVDARRPRKSLVQAVRPSDAERQMHRLLERYSAQVWKEAGARGDESARLVSIILRKRALSSACSLLSSLTRRLELLRRVTRAEAHQLTLPLGDEDPLPDDEPLSALAARGLDDPVREQRWLATLAEAARAATRTETKGRALLRLLRRIHEPSIVFTEYRDTLVLIAHRLAMLGRSIVLLHGGMSPAERTRAIEIFNNGGHTLLATDAAAEGLNLHRHCRLVVHYELPWNPARLEQRAGRVDRLGQDRRVHELAFVVADTAERLVLAPLAARAARASRGPGGSLLLEALTESEIARVVMDGADPSACRTPRSAAKPAIETMALGSEARAETERLLLERRWRARSARSRGRRNDRRPVVSQMTSRTSSMLKRGTILIYLLTIDDNDGRQIHAEPLAIHVAEPVAADGPRVASVIDRAIERMQARVGPLVARTRAALAQRDATIRGAHASTARALIQQDLFERRVAKRPQVSDVPLFHATESQESVLHAIATRIAVMHVGNPSLG